MSQFIPDEGIELLTNVRHQAYLQFSLKELTKPKKTLFWPFVTPLLSGWPFISIFWKWIMKPTVPCRRWPPMTYWITELIIVHSCSFNGNRKASTWRTVILYCLFQMHRNANKLRFIKLTLIHELLLTQIKLSSGVLTSFRTNAHKKIDMPRTIWKTYWRRCTSH